MPPAPLTPPVPDCPPDGAFPPEPPPPSEPPLLLAPPSDVTAPALPPASAPPAVRLESVPGEPLHASALLAHRAAHASKRQHRAGDWARRGSKLVVLTLVHSSARGAATQVEVRGGLRQLHAKNRGWTFFASLPACCLAERGVCKLPSMARFGPSCSFGRAQRRAATICRDGLCVPGRESRPSVGLWHRSRCSKPLYWL